MLPRSLDDTGSLPRHRDSSHTVNIHSWWEHTLAAEDSYDLELVSVDGDESSPPVGLEPRNYITRITGPILVNEVLQMVFLFLTEDLYSLVSVGHVCRAWRERSARIPQWVALGAPTRYDLIKKFRDIQADRQAGLEQEMQHERTQYRKNMICVALSLICGMAFGVTSLVAAYNVGREPNSASLIGVGGFFATFFLSSILIGSVASLSSETISKVGSTFFPNGRLLIWLKSVLLFIYLLTLSLAVPLGMLGGRMYSLKLLDSSPTLVLSCNVTYDALWKGFSDPPSFVYFANTADWVANNEISTDGHGHGVVSLRYVGPPCSGDRSPMVKVFLTLESDLLEKWNGTNSTTYTNLTYTNQTQQWQQQWIRSWRPQQSIYRTPLHTSYYDADSALSKGILGIGERWYQHKYGRWHIHRHVILRASASLFPGTPQQTRDEFENWKG